VPHAHPPFYWYNNSVPLYQYGAYNEFLDAQITMGTVDYRSQTATIHFLAPASVTATATPEPTAFIRYCPNPSTEEGKCAFNYQYCVPGQLRMICDCTACPVPKGAISPCESFCNPADATPTPTPLATLPPATATPAITSTPTALPSAVIGTQTPVAPAQNNDLYALVAGVILLMLVVVAVLSMMGGAKPPTGGTHHSTSTHSSPAAPSQPAQSTRQAAPAQPPKP
jgi:hypothetical protein